MPERIINLLKLFSRRTVAPLLSVYRGCYKRYKLDVKYQKGSLMVMSDLLSRAYLDEIPTQTEYCHELEKIVLVEDTTISEARLKEFKEGTVSDDNLQMLMTVVLEGWPKSHDEVSAEVKPYFQSVSPRSSRHWQKVGTDLFLF